MDHAVISDQWLATLRYVGAGAAAPPFGDPFWHPFGENTILPFHLKNPCYLHPFSEKSKKNCNFEPFLKNPASHLKAITNNFFRYNVLNSKFVNFMTPAHFTFIRLKFRLLDFVIS